VTRRALAAVLGVALLALSCARSDAPADPVWGKEPCAHCAMLVSDKAHAAQALHDGDRRYFDDIGCMILWLEKNKANGDRAWVRDADAGGWVDARSSRYADGAKTPMDFGLQAKRGGPLGWDEARTRALAKERNP